MPLIELPDAGLDATPYVTTAELRALPNLANEVRFPDEALEAASDWFETTFEDYVGMAFVPRLATERVNGTGSCLLRLAHWPVRSVTAVRVFTTATASTAYSAEELTDVVEDTPGYLRRWSLGSFAAGRANIEVDYIHGQAAVPADVARAALTAISEKLMEDNSGRPTDRTYGVATDGVFVRSILPGPDKPFGIASVDEVAGRYRARYHVPGCG